MVVSVVRSFRAACSYCRHSKGATTALADIVVGDAARLMIVRRPWPVSRAAAALSALDALGQAAQGVGGAGCNGWARYGDDHAELG
jgi:hypothetical protein